MYKNITYNNNVMREHQFYQKWTTTTITGLIGCATELKIAQPENWIE